MEKNFIIIFDLTPQRIILYVSDSVTDVLGYTPDELIGKTGLYIIPEDHISGTNTFIAYQEISDSLATVLFCTARKKDSKVIPIECVASCCYNMITATIVEGELNNSKSKDRVAAADNIVYIDKNPNCIHKVDGPQLLRLHKSQLPSTPIQFEPRVCMVLNRFTRKLTIMYCSIPASFVLGMNSKKCTGTSFISYIHQEDLSATINELDRVKSTACIGQVDLRFLSPELGTINVSVVVSASCDGLIAILRRSE
ncbi:hypothetical protein K493DRAFT_337423 [Basidiobolus meristosporus CBS 931.73]|uniref:PAS domain-containing protein n=1 Tax=Basidiobolus meristosporus CBS 931.73 TaxID=1314790 RepID=A0A1Y1YB84_9FUNG|nr:hypothetical protein K493DRAFT_337423 [Basidiobolus meristosporus CBS 931.73]|eukprot:ORX95269.1 hypothetical protein K493DRAFT_337423 [Basidiobolus meristosporus CBS 931.73]